MVGAVRSSLKRCPLRPVRNTGGSPGVINSSAAFRAMLRWLEDIGQTASRVKAYYSVLPLPLLKNKSSVMS